MWPLSAAILCAEMGPFDVPESNNLGFKSQIRPHYDALFGNASWV